MLRSGFNTCPVPPKSPSSASANPVLGFSTISGLNGFPDLRFQRVFGSWMEYFSSVTRKVDEGKLQLPESLSFVIWQIEETFSSVMPKVYEGKGSFSCPLINSFP